METHALRKTELLQVADVVARERGIDRNEVIDAMEQAIQRAGRLRYGQDNDIRAEIDRRSGDITMSRHREIVDEVVDEALQISTIHAKRIDATHEAGGFVVESLPPLDFGRISVQAAKQVIVQKVRDAERSHQFEEYRDRVGDVVNGLVKRTDYGGVVVDLGRAEGVILRKEMIPRENYRIGDRIRAYIMDVRREQRGPQIFLSRTHPQFMVKLFTQEVPEIYDGIILITAVARDPGSRAKIAVTSKDASIDPVGACVGMRGSRVQAVVGELQGEKIDIIPWASDRATFIVNALAPAEVTKVVMDDVTRRVEVIVPDPQLSLAIGRRGQNVRLAAQLTGWEIDILTEIEESERRTDEYRRRTAEFIEALDVDDVIAHLLAAEDFASVDEIADVDPTTLSHIDGFDDDVAAELHQRARNFVEVREKTLQDRREALGLQDDLLEVAGIRLAFAVTLAEKNIRSRDDLADLATDELVDLLGEGEITPQDASRLILAARAHWYDEAETEQGEDSEPVEDENAERQTQRKADENDGNEEAHQ